MLLPIGDLPNPKTTPYINWLLIGLNIAVFVAVTLPLSMTRPDLNDPALVEYLRSIGARGSLPTQYIYQHVTAYDLFVFKYGFRPAAFSLLSTDPASFSVIILEHSGPAAFRRDRAFNFNLKPIPFSGSTEAT